MGDNDAVDFQLAAYYLDCISRDRDDKVSAYLTNAYGNVEYNQVFSRPEADVADAASYSTDARALFAKVRRSPTSLQRLVVFCPTYDTSLSLDSCMHELKKINMLARRSCWDARLFRRRERFGQVLTRMQKIL